MKLYVWDRVVALKGDTHGLVVVFAENKKEAVDLAIREFFYEEIESNSVFSFIQDLEDIIQDRYPQYAHIIEKHGCLDIVDVMDEMPDVVEDISELRAIKILKDELERTKPKVFGNGESVAFYIWGSELG